MSTRVLVLIAALAWLPSELHSETAIPTESVVKSLKQIATAGHGILYGLTVDGEIQAWDGKAWQRIEVRLRRSQWEPRPTSGALMPATRYGE